MKLSELYLNRYLYRDNTQDSATKDSVFESNDSSDPVSPGIASGGAAQDINQGNVMINPGNLPDSTINVGDWGWTQTCAFSSTDLNTVSWGGGNFIDAAGNTYIISAGNTDARLTAAGLTSPMNAKTYIYLSLLDSETVYNCTYTSGDAVGVGKVLIAVAQNDTVTSLRATYNLSEATQIVGDNILANTINASKITTGSLIVGTNVGLGTAQDSAGVTTIVGGVVTTSFVNALNVTAQYVVASISISSPTITGGSIAIGSGNNIFKADSNGIYLGNATFASAPFRVSMAGALTATSVTISGSLTTGTGSSISGTYISNINADTITTGTLSAITVQTSSGNNRIKLVSDTIQFYSGGALKATLDGSSAASGGVKNTGDFFIANNKSYWVTSSGGGASEYGGMSITSSNEFWLTLGTANTFFIKNNAQSSNYLTASSARTYINGYLLLQTFSSNVSSTSGSIWHYSSGADQFRGVPTGSTVYSFDMTVV